MRFFHRHHTFNQLFCIFDYQDIKKIRKEINNNETNIILILVYNNIKKIIDVNKDPLEEFFNVKYLIINKYNAITKNEVLYNNNIVIRRNNKNNKNEIKINVLDDFQSIFT